MSGAIGLLIGQGRTAEVFEWEANQVIKLFRAGHESSAERELAAARVARRLGAETPIVHEVVRVDGRLGLVFERISGKSLMTEASGKPWLLGSAARRMARSHRAIHGHEAPSLPSILEQLERLIRRAQGLRAAQQRRAVETLARLPDGNSLCHGDFHPGNLLDASNRELIVIDWATAGRGHPLVDVAVTAVMMRFAEVPAGTSLALRSLSRFVRKRLTADYLAAYGLSESERVQLSSFSFALYAARLGRGVEAERPALLRALNALDGN